MCVHRNAPLFLLLCTLKFNGLLSHKIYQYMKMINLSLMSPQIPASKWKKWKIYINLLNRGLICTCCDMPGDPQWWPYLITTQLSPISVNWESQIMTISDLTVESAIRQHSQFLPFLKYELKTPFSLCTFSHKIYHWSGSIKFWRFLIFLQDRQCINH